MMKRTIQPKVREIQRRWHVIDAQGKILGRLSVQVAQLLIGKNKVNYVGHLDLGDYVVVVNSEKVVLSGNKEKGKLYYRHSGYPGGLKISAAEKVRREHPERLIVHSVGGMLPRNKLRDRRLARLRVVVGPKNPFVGEAGV